MAKDFEAKVLEALGKLEKDVGGLSTDVGSLQKGLSSLQKDVHRLEVLHEETKTKIDTVIEIGNAQKELWKKAATKEDLFDVEQESKINRLPIRAHSSQLADIERRLKRVETKLKTA